MLDVASAATTQNRHAHVEAHTLQPPRVKDRVAGVVHAQTRRRSRCIELDDPKSNCPSARQVGRLLVGGADLA